MAVLEIPKLVQVTHETHEVRLVLPDRRILKFVTARKAESKRVKLKLLLATATFEKIEWTVKSPPTVTVQRRPVQYSVLEDARET